MVDLLARFEEEPQGVLGLHLGQGRMRLLEKVPDRVDIHIDIE